METKKKTGSGTVETAKNKGGRPLALSVEGVKARGEKFFSDCDANKKPYTLSGLALACGFYDRRQMREYEARERFGPTIKRLLTRVEQYAEEHLHTSMPTGPIFALKQLGWRDVTELVGAGGGPLAFQVVDRFGKLPPGEPKALPKEGPKALKAKNEEGET
jgi:hypothetical protein